jgi:hypothetical protein
VRITADARRVLSDFLPSRLRLADHLPIPVDFESGLRDPSGDEVHAAAAVRPRRVWFDDTLRTDPAELRRIAVHEAFHFVWIRLGNPRRASFETLISGEIAARARGELGWSAQCRKAVLSPTDSRDRTRRWREYLCESFCDTAAWVFAAFPKHPEYTLAGRFRSQRKRWFEHHIEGRRISL